MPNDRACDTAGSSREPTRFREPRPEAMLLLAWLFACGGGGGSGDRFTVQMRDALSTLAGAQDVYYATNQRYSDDPSITTSVPLAPGVVLLVWSADRGGWNASASHDSSSGSCVLLGRKRGNTAFAVLDGPTCTASPLSAATRDSLARASGAPSEPASAPLASGALPSPPVMPVIGPPGQEFGYPTQTVDRLAVRRLLIARSYDALDALLAAYADSVARDYRVEYRLFDFYGAFDVAIAAFEPPLTAWVQQRPASAAARLARATFFVASGWHARGSNWARETPDARFRRMDDFFRLAVADLSAAHRLAPAALPTYYQLMRIALSRGDGATSRQILDEALAIQPYSFLLRAQHMYALEPRWGGSYEAMARFADECAPYAEGNARIAALRGFADMDRGRELERDDQLAAAVEAFDRALRSGDFWRFRYRRGQVYAEQQRPADALGDFTRALLQRPQDADILYARAGVEYALGYAAPRGTGGTYFRQGFRDIALAVELDPTDERNQHLLTFYRQAVPAFAPPAEP